MGDFINNLIPYGTNMTPYYIGIAFIFWIVGLIFLAKEQGANSENFMYASIIWTVLSAVWWVLIIYTIIAIPITIIWKLFGGKKDVV